ncbi:type IV pilus assembly protein PilM [Patescibacteria group bacterium]|nr:type IV pilus assembly protein PilM [Patescibacteria group bacterium]
MFWFGKNTFLGIDIGNSSIKIVELKVQDNKPVLSNYAWMDLSHTEGLRMDEEVWELCLKRIIKEGKIKGKNAYISIPSSGSLIVLFDLPEMAKEDLDQAVRFEAHKYVPVSSMEDVIISWDILGPSLPNHLNKSNSAAESNKKSGKTMQILLVAASKNRVEKCEKVIEKVGLKLKSIEVENFALTRSLIGNDQGNFIIAEIGSVICNIILVEKGVIKSSRNIDAGGSNITKMISNSLQVDEKRAEQMKISGENFFDSKLGINLTTLEVVVGEIKKVLYNYYKSEDNSRLNGIILSGGTAGLRGIENYFSEALKTKTFIGNPLSRLSYDRRLDPILGKNKNKFSVALGLALKGMEEYQNK